MIFILQCKRPNIILFNLKQTTSSVLSSHSSDISIMMHELKEQGYDPVHHPITKALLLLFFLNLKPNKNTYNFQHLYHR